MTYERVISWFSCGAASAVASKLALQEHGKIEIIYQETNSEHPDNERFLKDCEKWYGQKIIRLSSSKYHDIWAVFKHQKWLTNSGGAPCTAELKRMVAERYLNHGKDLEIFGYTVDERKRVMRFCKNNPERSIQAILVERGLTKEDCLGMIAKAGIEIPTMYKLGYTNNNCIGCVKGGMGYWNKIRVDFPAVFDRMAKVERDMDHSILQAYKIDKKDKTRTRKRVFLDELDPDAGHHLSEPKITCGIMCEQETDGLEAENMEC